MPDHPTPERWERDQLIQLIEQVKGLRHDINHHARLDEDTYRKIDVNIEALRTSLDTRFRDSKYVTRAEFNPTRMISYGLVALIVTSVVTALISIVVSGKAHIGP